MTRIDPQRLDEIFRGALECSGDKRATYIAERCDGDPGLIGRVNRLLAAANAPDEHLAAVMSETRRRWLQQISEGPQAPEENLSGQVIGRWRIVERVARGGLASVYLAQRDDGQYQQRAAFKVLRRGLDTDDVIARFRTESQILSSLEHVAISQIIDGGVLGDGRPYLVLEYVEGMSITAHCASRQVDIRGRLQLVVQMLEALQQAHKHLVVHRDIKPSNVSVTAEGRVVLLDFGIAKLLNPSAFPGEGTHTRTGLVLLTPGYGSPEQHAGKAVTTASDIYQAGAVLFELLAGVRPESAANFTRLSSVTPPSQRAQSAADRKRIRGDLDAIVMKAMHPDPGERYASASEMVSDILRYLDNQPVSAQADTARYRLNKLVHRHPWLLPSLALAVVLVAGYVLTLTRHNQAIVVEQQRAMAAQAFMVDLLGSASPYESAEGAGGRDMRVVDALDAGVLRLRDSAYGGDKQLRASLLVTISGVYGSLDRHESAIDLRSEALELQRKLYGNPSGPVIDSLRALAHQYRTIGNYALAEALYAEQLSAARALYPAGHPDVGVAEAASALMHLRRGRLAESRTLGESAVASLRTAAKSHGREYINAAVGLVRARGGKNPGADLALLQEAMEIAETGFGEDSPLAALVASQYGVSLSEFGDRAAARLHFNRAIDIYKREFGRDHGATLAAFMALGDLEMQSGELAVAALLYREVLESYREKYGEAHLGVALAYQKIADIAAGGGAYVEAVALYRSAFGSRLAVLGRTDASVYSPLLQIARVQLLSGDYQAAEHTTRGLITELAGIDAAGPLAAQAQCVLDLRLTDQNAGTSSPASELELSTLVAPEVDMCDLATH